MRASSEAEFNGMDKNRFVAMWLMFSLSPFGRWLQLDRLPVNPTPNDGFSRFILHSGDFRSGGRIMPSAVLPMQNKKTTRWKTSIHRTDGLRSELIWILGYQYVENRRRAARIRARGLAQVLIVTVEAGLHLDVNGRPYPRHADIVGWPTGEKHNRMMLAAQIANKLQLERDPRPA
jgi:hypothetical protein